MGEIMSKVTKALEWDEVEPDWLIVKQGDERPSIMPPFEVRQSQRNAAVRVRGLDSDMHHFKPFDGTIEQAKAACHARFEELVTRWLV